MAETRATDQIYGILDAVPVGAFLLRSDYTVLFWNRCLEEWTSIPRGRLLGTDIRSWFPHLRGLRYAIRLDAIFAGGPPTIFSSQLHRNIIPVELPDGHQRIQHATVTAVPAAEGPAFDALFAIEDVTDLTNRLLAYRRMRDQAIEEIGERSRAEEELRRVQENLELRVEERTRSLVELNERLQKEIADRTRMEAELLRAQKLESLGVLAGGIAHDFNNLLTAILGNISLARRAARPGDVAHDRLTDAEKASLRARELTRQLLTFSKGGVPVKRTASIGELIRESSSFILRGSAVKCECILADDLWPVEIDAGQMSQVINNIIVNADQAMPEGGTISLKAENAFVEAASGLPLNDGPHVKISIRDDGVGIPGELIEKIFDPYFTTKSSGTGLGLTTSYAIVKNHNGHITLESQPGAGTTFYIYLPASQDAVLPKKQNAALVMGRGRVLVVDDEEIVRISAGRMLHDLGYEVDFARDGKEAIETYQKARELQLPFDMVILDLTIPGGMGGKETIKRLRELDPSVKAIVSSGYSNDPIMAEFRRHGFSGIVEKPYTFEELSQTLSRVITSAEETSGAA